MKKLTALLISIMLLVTLLAGCKAKTAAGEPAAETTAAAAATTAALAETTAAAAAEPAAAAQAPIIFHARYLFNSTQSGVTDTTYNGGQNGQNLNMETLCNYDTDTKKYVNKLADTLNVSGDGLTYTVKLKDATFHDGEKCTTEDVLFSYEYGAKFSSQNKLLASLEGFDAFVNGGAEHLSGIRIIDDKTLEFHLTEQNATFMAALSHSHFSILPKHILDTMDWANIRDCSFWASPVGTGPFYVSETHYPDYYVDTRYENYHSEPAGVETVIFKYYTDMEAINAAMIAGEVDWSCDTGFNDAVNIAAQNPDIEVILSDSIYCRALAFNLTGRAEDGQYNSSILNARVRQAINMLIDKESLCTLYGDVATPLTTMVNSAVADYNTDIPKFERNVEEAKKILAEENFDFSTPIRIYAYYTDQTTVDLLDILVQNLAEGGIKAEYYVDGNNAGAIAAAGNFDLEYFATGGVYAKDLYNVFHDDVILDPTLRDTYYKERYTDLQQKWATTMDEAGRKEIIDQIQFNGMEDMNAIPLYTMSAVTVLNTGHIEGFPAHSSDYNSYYDIKASEWVNKN